MVTKVRYLLLSAITLLLVQCDLEKEVEIKLPEYADTPYIECYLEPGEPYRLLAYRSIGYFDGLVPPPITDAIISVTHRGVSIAIPYDSIPRDGDIRYYNYRTHDSIKVPAHYDEAFDLAITINGTTYHSATTIRPFVPIDSTYNSCNEKQRCKISLRFKDQVNKADFYRYITFADSLGGDRKQDILFNDEFFDSEEAEISGGYSFNEGQPAVIRLYHLTKEHYDFLVSVKNSQNANGNPFAQPASIKSNIPGILGIFTGLTYDSKEEDHVQ